MRVKLRPRIVVPVFLILITLFFIWSNSARPGSDSLAQSNVVASWIRAVFDVERQPFRFLYEHHRKVAHFLEFALLGAEMGFFLLLNGKKGIRFFCFSMIFCAVCATIDESIQLFVPGRACALTDVLIDTAGSACSLIFLFLLSLLRKSKASS